jgi:hypothetical protein
MAECQNHKPVVVDKFDGLEVSSAQPGTRIYRTHCSNCNEFEDQELENPVPEE